ncbi:MAG: hypothetical protein KKB74_11785 [Bacteroidetes bacterium]|nr:hypothetical protein [Bacteroidota bacterium]
MTKKESMAILLACKKHGIFMTVRNEGDDHLAGFLNKLEIRSFEAAKYITNGLVIESRLKKGQTMVPKPEASVEPNVAIYRSSNKKFRGPNDDNWMERRRAQYEQEERDEQKGN